MFSASVESFQEISDLIDKTIFKLKIKPRFIKLKLMMVDQSNVHQNMLICLYDSHRFQIVSQLGFVYAQMSQAYHKILMMYGKVKETHKILEGLVTYKRDFKFDFRE